MTKKIVALVIVLVAICLSSSCSKDSQAWRVETDSVYYVKSEYATYKAFSNAIDALDGTTYTVSKVRNKIDQIVREYDNDVIQCTIYLKVGPTTEGPWSIDKTWNLKFNSRYN